MDALHTFVILAYKESIYLEECIKSVINQSYNSEVVIATTTDNKYIRDLAQKYKLEVVVGKHTNIGGDFDFAVSCGKTALVTVAHQDDLYDYEYAKTIVDEYLKYADSTIIFTDYYKKPNYHSGVVIYESEKNHGGGNVFCCEKILVKQQKTSFRSSGRARQRVGNRQKCYKSLRCYKI